MERKNNRTSEYDIIYFSKTTIFFWLAPVFSGWWYGLLCNVSALFIDQYTRVVLPAFFYIIVILSCTFSKNNSPMKSSYIVLGVILLVVLFAGCGAMSGYNNMNTMRGDVDEKWANVQSAYQRRSDLIPNLVNTVKGAANFETTTLTQVIEARAKATSINVNASDLTDDKLKQIQASQGQISQALGRLMVVSEQYPQLKANQNFLSLQDQLEGTENRIKAARDGYNGAVKTFNVQVTSFPANIYAGMFGFKARPFFQADDAAQKAPSVQF